MDTPKFELNLLKRDWIEGISGDAFWQLVQKYIGKVAASIRSATERGVLIAESDPVEFAAAFFASVHSGIPVILANPNWQRSEWEQLNKQLSPAIVFGESGIAEKKPAGTHNPAPGTILIPTGGSSGRLKLAIHTWDTLTAACEGFRSFAGTEPIHSCCVLPLYHVSGLMQLMRSFVSGGQIVFTDYKALQAGKFPRIDTEKLCLSLVPTQLQRIIEQEPVVNWLCNLKAIFLGGAPLSLSLQTLARKLNLPLAPSYGMTETAAMITALPVRDFLSGNSSVGLPLEHVTIQVIREDDSICAPLEKGSIHIRARSLCLGYHNLPSNISTDGYRSMDDGYLDPDNYIHIIGRSDRLIISGGEKIDPLEVEDAFLQTGIVSQVLALGWPDPEWGKRLIAFYIPGNHSDDVEVLRTKLKITLANYKIPREIVKVAQLPLTVQGKPDHALIKKLLRK